ncbi:hypothetical protein H6503_02365 [Candidatus Woesearchaeota archaeon]|nr:hypothetical protein [Candidatus Woesearchaeota archaeon]
MAKCELCKEKVGETFLNKVLGSYIKDEAGKKHLVCSNCQSKLKDKTTILENLK